MADPFIANFTGMIHFPVFFGYPSDIDISSYEIAKSRAELKISILKDNWELFRPYLTGEKVLIVDEESLPPSMKYALEYFGLKVYDVSIFSKPGELDICS